MQNFKGDDLELKMQSVANPAFDVTDIALDEFYAGGESCGAFVLMLYDEGRIPFSDRIPRNVFVPFYRRALENFPVTGTFDSYLFILAEIFGEESEIFFEVTDPGKLSISVSAIADVLSQAVVREFNEDTEEYEFFDLITMGDEPDLIVFRGISGIETEAELNLIFAEIMPAGIVPDISLNFFEKSFFLVEDDSVLYNVIDHDGNELIFREVGE